MSQSDRLLIFPSLRGYPGSNGSIVLTRKFVDGILEYVKRWQGDVMVCVRRASDAGTNLDHCEVDPSDVPFELCWMPEDDSERNELLNDAGLILATLIDEHVHFAPSCHEIGVPLVYISEYSVLTRQQIIRAETTNPLLRWRRERWTTRLERRFERAIPLAAGIQCNGTPTYHSYQSLSERALLYFDTRIRENELAPLETVDERVKHMMSDGPLRLAFSGRLIRMKGAHHLPQIAMELKSRNVPFTLDICGGGELENQLRRDIQRLQLNDQVRLRGVLDFKTELTSFVTDQVDLFVCCHPQGDPSCTYLETMSCGVPIVGYANEAFQGLIENSSVGWATPIGYPEKLADQIQYLNNNRAELMNAAVISRTFAEKHTFEKTMQTRVEHMQSCMQDVKVQRNAVIATS